MCMRLFMHLSAHRERFTLVIIVESVCQIFTRVRTQKYGVLPLSLALSLILFVSRFYSSIFPYAIINPAFFLFSRVLDRSPRDNRSANYFRGAFKYRSWFSRADVGANASRTEFTISIKFLRLLR